MSWSLGEIQSLAIKASRGAGFTWGIAEEAGFAVRWLESMGLPGCAVLQAYLDSQDSVVAAGNRVVYPLATSPLASCPLATCPLATGTHLLDHQRQHPVDLGRVSHPLLLVPFLAAYADMPCELTWQSSQADNTLPVDATIHIGHKMANTSMSIDKLLVNTAYCHTRYSSYTGESVNASITRVADSNRDAVKALASWASKTYAPITEQSRLTGAGAGVSDND